jgi:cobalt-zinc-cadmium efflux system outer membrane protein
MRIISWPLAAVLLAGCAKYPKNAGFNDVQQQVMQRSGLQVQWNRGTDADRQAAEAIHAFLQKELTADTAVQVALLNNQNLQAVYEGLGIAQAEVVEAGLLKNPTLSARLGIPRYVALPYQIDVTQDFLDLLFMPMRKRIAGAQFEAAKLRATDTVITTASQVKAGFYRAQGAAQMVEVRRNVAAVTDASWATAQKLHDAGNITDLVFANERAEQQKAHIELAKEDREALDAREELNGLMGLGGSEVNWKMSPRLPAPPAGEPDLRHAESLAVARRADIGAAREQVLANAESLGLSRSSAWLADAKIGVGVDQDVDGPFTVGPSVELPLPIFNQGQPAIAAAVSRLRQSQRQYFALTAEARTQVRRARNRMLADREMAEYYRSVFIPLQKQIVEQEQLQFNAMQVNLFELLMAKQAEIDAGRDYVQALQDYWVARAELERVTGGMIAFPTSPTTQEHP